MTAWGGLAVAYAAFSGGSSSRSSLWGGGEIITFPCAGRKDLSLIH